MTRITSALSVAILFCATAACDRYDPPPVATLLAPANGTWALDEPLTFTFSESVDPKTLKITVWPYERDEEGDFPSTTIPLFEGCTPETSPCSGATITLNDTADEATVDLSELFKDKLGEPYILEIHSGLKDKGGKELIIPQFFDFQISPTSGQGPVEAPLNSGVMFLVADLTEILPGVYLRLFVDIAVDRETGEMWIAGTVAQIDPEVSAPNNSTDPTQFVLYEDDRGWVVPLTGTITETEPGKLFIETQPQTITVMVLGIIWVQLQEFRFEATVETSGKEDVRDYGEGLLSTDKILMGDASDPDDLGSGVAPLVITGIYPEEIDPALPQLCEEDPCKELNALGGDCQLVYPWEKVAACP